MRGQVKCSLCVAINLSIHHVLKHGAVRRAGLAGRISEDNCRKIMFNPVGGLGLQRLTLRVRPKVQEQWEHMRWCISGMVSNLPASWLDGQVAIS